MRATNWVKSIARVKSDSRVEARVLSAGYYAGYFQVTMRETTGGDNARACEMQFDRAEADRLKEQLDFYFSQCELSERAKRTREADSIAAVNEMIANDPNAGPVKS